jgi:hypothetical protein
VYVANVLLLVFSDELNAFKLLTEIFTLAEVVSKFVNLGDIDAVNEFIEPVADSNPVKVARVISFTTVVPATNLIEPVEIYKSLQMFVAEPKSNALVDCGINDADIPPLMLSNWICVPLPPSNNVFKSVFMYGSPNTNEPDCCAAVPRLNLSAI